MPCDDDPRHLLYPVQCRVKSLVFRILDALKTGEIIDQNLPISYHIWILPA